MSQISNNNPSLNFTKQLADNIPAAILSPSGKLIGPTGSVKTSLVLSKLEDFVAGLQKGSSKLDDRSLEQVNTVLDYLTVLLDARGDEKLIPSKLNPAKISERQSRLDHVKKAFADAVPGSVHTTRPEHGEGKMGITFINQDNTVTVSRNAHSQVTVETREEDKALSPGHKRDLQSRLRQVDSDWARRASTGVESICFADPIEGATPLNKLENFCKGIDPRSKTALIAELYAKLPEGDKKTENATEDLAVFYQILPGETDKESAILAKQIYLSTAPTTMLTSYMHLGQAINVQVDASKVVPEIRLVRDSATGLSRPKVQADGPGVVEVKTRSAGKTYVPTHQGTITATCDPVQGVITGKFVLSPQSTQ